MFGLFSRKPSHVVGPDEALEGRSEPVFDVPDTHFVNGQPLKGPWPGTQQVSFGMGCFWGAERILWQTPGVVCTAAGYQGGHTPNPTYEETCTGRTGHTEVVLVAYDPDVISFDELLKVFWENHDPTQGMRQGNDVGTVYRSAIYVNSPEQLAAAERSLQAYDTVLREKGYDPISTEVRDDGGTFWYAEPYHQQYLAKNPNGYCGIGGTGVSCPIGLGV